jgi:TP901 family phage tail tape measure protein
MARGLTLPVILVVRRIGGQNLRNFGRDMRGAQRATSMAAKSMGVDFGVMTGVMQAALVGLAATAAGLFSAAKTAGVFEQSIQAAAFAVEAADSQIQGLRNSALDADIALRGVGALKAAKALREIGAEGLTAAEAMTVLAPAIDLARASFFELSPEKAGGLLVQTMRIFNIETGKATDTVDKLTRASTVSAIRLEKLNLFMGIAATGAEAFGTSLTDTLSAAALIRGVIPRVERGSTALRGLFDDLADSTRQAKLQTELGVAAIDKQTGEFRNLFDIVMDVQSATRGMTNAQREAKLQNVFQIEAIAGLRAMMVALEKGYKDANGQILKQGDALKFLRGEIENSQGATADLVNRQRNTFQGGLEAMAAGFENFKVGLGDALFFVGFAFQAVGATLSIIGSIFSNLPGPAKIVLGVLFSLVLVAGALAGTVLLIGLAFGTLKGAALLAVPAMKLAFTTIVTGIRSVLTAFPPLLIASLALAAVIAIIVSLWNMFTGNKESPNLAGGLQQARSVAGGLGGGGAQVASLTGGGAGGSVRGLSVPGSRVDRGSGGGGVTRGQFAELIAINRKQLARMGGQDVVMDGEKIGELQDARRARIASRQFRRNLDFRRT